MSSARGEIQAVEDGTRAANSVLLLVPSMDPADDQGCARLLSRGSIEEEGLLCVTLADSPDDRMAAWNVHLDGEPAKIGFVDVDDPARSVAAASGSIETLDRSVSVRSVSNPGDLTGLGIEITRVLDEWKDDVDDTVVCFHSLTTLLQYVDVQRAFRFLHVLTGRIAAVGAVGHFHMDPMAHDEREINTLKTLFDAVVEFEDGEWIVSSR